MAKPRRVAGPQDKSTTAQGKQLITLAQDLAEQQIRQTFGTLKPGSVELEYMRYLFAKRPLSPFVGKQRRELQRAIHRIVSEAIDEIFGGRRQYLPDRVNQRLIGM